jgi:hypothetical protein
MYALLATAAVAQSTPGTVSGTFTPEERLEAIRQGLVQAALEGATRVESVTWLDGQGVLREGSSFRSGMEVRGVQVLSYLRDSAGQAQARLQLPPGAAVKTAGLPDRKDVVREILEPGQKCGNPAALRHLVGLRMTVEGGWSVDQAPSAHALGQLTASLLQQVGSVSAGWAMLEKSVPARTGYEQVLVGTSDNQLPWHAFLSVRPAPPLPMLTTESAPLFWMRPSLPERPIMALLSFSLVARGQNKPVFEASAEIEMPLHTQVWGRPKLEASMREQAANLIQPWTQALAQQFSCAVVQPTVISVRGAQLSFNAGALAGVRPGDEWLLADPRRFPQQILASGVAATAVLARVGQVYPLQAQLQIVAGPADQVRTDWRAWRADSPVSSGLPNLPSSSNAYPR